jgi:LPXTG-site transpeptidase (sortase) family protein
VRKHVIGNILMILGLMFLVVEIAPYLYDELKYDFNQLFGPRYILNGTDESSSSTSSIFGHIISKSELSITPVNTDFALVIEKIDVNVPVVPRVSVTVQAKYMEALRNGVAHAAVSDLPSENAGNVYIFAHSSLNYWALGKYATAFNLLKKLETGDKVFVFYKQKRFEYHVTNKEIYPGWNVYPLTRAVIEPILTLQTCDPPGTTLNRLIVTAKLYKATEVVE